ncbi:putative bifunctional diguanylate cyclase/phosphodiesterase [Oceanisphaera sp.]|uniref:putative bifunctional diguanylate cyclase/phosphodiesterase n=1 Tax=Oceanisphaera sp. TaxID=1929979 RepID=UPI003A90B351
MGVETFDVAVEILKALVSLSILGVLIWQGRSRNLKQKGWARIVTGFALLTFASLLDITDEFAALSPFIVIGDTPAQAFLEKVVGYSGGFLMLLWGLLIWLPTQSQMTERLHRQVREHTSELLKAKTFTEAVVGQSHDLVVACNIDGHIIHCNNRNLEDLPWATAGLSLKEWHRRYPCYAANGESPLSLKQLPLYRALRGEVIEAEEITIREQDQSLHILLLSGGPIHDETGNQIGAMISAYDITAQKRLEEQLRHQAQHDNLTGLPNRLLFHDRLTQAIQLAHRSKAPVTVMMLDLDRFKEVNDSLGHAAGDLLLQQVTRRLQLCLRAHDTLARLGGDEFAIVLVPTQHDVPFSPQTVAKRILEQLTQPFWLHEQQVRISVSIGIAQYPEDGQTSETLLLNADAAMYQAKAEGRNAYHCYQPELNQEALTRLTLENDLAQALERNQFSVHYQPLVQAANGRCVAVEALLRWQHPVRGPISPAEFIPLAERSGLIVPLGEWVLRTACSQLQHWQQQGLPLLRVSVNLSERQLHQPDLVKRIAQILQETRLPAGSLELELTESMLIQGNESILILLASIRQLGVQLAIDDFGTGYSSLSYLKQFPVSRLKLDRSFVQDIPRDTVLSLAIIELAHRLHMKVVAEGVENEAQRDFLIAHGCDELQGFLFSRAVPADELAQLLAPTGTTPSAFQAGTPFGSPARSG